MFGLQGEFLKNPTDYRSYAVCISILWCVMWWGLSAKQRDAPNPSGRLVSFMVYARKLGRGGGRGGKSGLGEHGRWEVEQRGVEGGKEKGRGKHEGRERGRRWGNRRGREGVRGVREGEQGGTARVEVRGEE